jgi:hypothetical protein
MNTIITNIHLSTEKCPIRIGVLRLLDGDNIYLKLYDILYLHGYNSISKP